MKLTVFFVLLLLVACNKNDETAGYAIKHFYNSNIILSQAYSQKLFVEETPGAGDYVMEDSIESVAESSNPAFSCDEALGYAASRRILSVFKLHLDDSPVDYQYYITHTQQGNTSIIRRGTLTMRSNNCSSSDIGYAGRVSFYTSNNPIPIRVRVTNTVSGRFNTKTIPKIGPNPGCRPRSDSASVTFKLMPGNYRWSAEDGIDTWSGGSFVIREDDCFVTNIMY